MRRIPVEARAIVPAPRRWGPTLSASADILDNADCLHRANENILVCPILDMKKSVDNLEEIASVPGIDVLSMGT